MESAGEENGSSAERGAQEVLAQVGGRVSPSRDQAQGRQGRQGLRAPGLTSPPRSTDPLNPGLLGSALSLLCGPSRSGCDSPRRLKLKP